PEPLLDRPAQAAVRRRVARGDDADRDQKARQREHYVAGAGEARVRPAAEEAGRKPDDEPDRDGDEGGGDADEERRARAVHRPHEEVAPGAVGAEPEVAVRPLRDAELVEHRVVVGVDRGVARDPRGERAAEDGDQDQERDHDRREHRRPVLPEALPEEPPGAPRLDDFRPRGRAAGGATRAEQVGCGCHVILCTRAARKLRSLPSTGGKYKTRYLRPELATG